MSTNTFSKARVFYPLVEEARAYADTNGLPIYNIAIGVTNPDPNYKISRQNSSCYTFEYVLEGKGEIVIDGKKLAVNKGDTYILFKGGNHTYRSLPESPMKKYWINFNCDYLSEMLNSYNLTQGVYKIDTLSAFENLLFTSKSDLPFSKLYSTIADSIHNVIVCAALSLKADVNINANLLKEKLLASIYKKPSLKQIASDLNMSESNLIRIFKKHFGITPYEFLLNAKIDAAKLLLQHSDMLVKEIADKLHFNDEHYFSTVFYKKTGVRPSKFRK